MEYNVNFMHPQYGTTMNVDIDGAFTVEEMIHNLQMSGFIASNAAGYDFALMDQQLDRALTFDEIEELYDGVVIRIIAHEKAVEKAENEVDSLLFNLRHPVNDEILRVALKTNDPLIVALNIATERNFVNAGAANFYQISKGDKHIDLNANAQNNHLMNDDYLQILQAGEQQENPLEATVKQFHTSLSALQTNIKDELKSIKDALPQSNMIPIDPTRAVNPTMQTYETMETIVNRMRAMSGQPPVKKIRFFKTERLLVAIVILCLITLILLQLLS